MTAQDTAVTYRASSTLPLRVEFIRQLRRRRTLVAYGLVIALPLAIIAAAAASRRTSLLTGVALVVGLTVFCILVFSYGLGLPLPLIGRWLKF